MYFTKVFFIFIVVMALCQNFSEAGQAGGKIAQEGFKKAGQALKEGGKKIPPVVVGGYSANSTYNVHVNTKPASRPASPKNG